MLMARSPLRISIGGGGTDLPSYYESYGGFLIAAAINKYVYVSAMKPFSPGIYLKYSQHEKVDLVNEISHPIIRETLTLAQFSTSQIEITTLADIPSGTGLGSSGSFTTALLKVMTAHKRQFIQPAELAELACHVEIDLLKEPIGKQDQYIAAYGGLTCFHFDKDGTVLAAPLQISEDTYHELEDNLLLFFTGYSRSASSVLKDQKEKTLEHDSEMLDNLHFVKSIGLKCKEALEEGASEQFGELMHEHWEYKKKRSTGMSNQSIDSCYQYALANGAIGGKLVGAGGGGFLLFYASDKRRLRIAMSEKGLREVPFSFDHEGTKMVIS